jgi:HPt (histidine-containing phosphotransfer) domain-containing protein
MAIAKDALEDYKDIMGDDYKEFVVDIIDTFFENSPTLFDELENAKNNNDPEAFQRAAHSLKSNGKTFGAYEFARLAYKLEQIGKSGNLSEASLVLNKLMSEYENVISELGSIRGMFD